MAEFVQMGLLIILAFLASSDAKRDFVVEWEGLEYDRDPNLPMKVEILRIGKFNRTTYVLNALGNFTIDLPRDTLISVTGYEKMASNKYSLIPIKLMSGTLCELFENDPLMMPGILANSNLPSKCPVLKGRYWLKDYIPDLSALPDRLPGGDRFRLDAVYTSKTTLLLKASYFIYVNRYI